MAKKTPAENPLTNKQELFVQEYLVDLNAAQAAIRAGYSEKTARAIGHENLTKPNIESALQAAMAKRADETGITAEKVLRELALLGMSSVADYQVSDEGGFEAASGVEEDKQDAIMRAVSSVRHKIRTTPDGNVVREVEFKLWDKPAALKMLGQHLSMFIERKEISGPGGGPIKVAPEDLDDSALAKIAAGDD